MLNISNTIDGLLQSALQHHQAGRLAEAQQIYQQILALQPDHADALHLLGVLASQRGEPAAALDLIRRALTIQPEHPVYHSNLGRILHDQGHLDEAMACYQRALTLQPTFADAYNNIGSAWRDRRQPELAIAAYQQALTLRPDYADAHNNIGNALRDLGRFADALAHHQRAVEIRPDFPEAHYNRGNACYDLGRLDEAAACYQRALQLRPNYAEAYSNLATVWKDTGRLTEAIATYHQAIALKPQLWLVHASLVYALYFHPDYDAPAIYRAARAWNARHGAPLQRLIQPHRNTRDPQRPLRIGYVSPNFALHVVGLFMLPLLENRNHAAFEVFCYSDAAKPDATTQRIRENVDQWRDTGSASDQQLADMVRADQIDILIDLTLHMAGSRLLVFAQKPAPVQVTYLAYAGTSGLETIDYRLTDPHLDPPGQGDTEYAEESFVLPETYWCYAPVTQTPEVGPLPALARGHVTFGSLNNFSKASTPTLDAWIRLLQQVAGARLVLHAPEGTHRQQLHQRLAHAGVDPQRLTFVGKQSAMDYFSQYHAIDIALDPFPYGGGTTTCDALWMGVPVVTLDGQTAVGRGAKSILTNIGLPELVAGAVEEYLQKARELAGDFPRLAACRATLRQRMTASPLMDAPRFARAIEAAYRTMWRRWCQDAPRTR